jgi:lipoate-protein ligase A
MVVIDETKINYSIKKPIRKDFENFNEYHKKNCEYLIQKYKDTYIKDEG